MRISQVAPERNLFHHQMVPDKKCDVVEDILVLQACEQCPGDINSDDFMISNSDRFRDVMA